MGETDQRVVIAPEQFQDGFPMEEHRPVAASTASAK